MSTKIWNLKYAMGNTERIVSAHGNPLNRKDALEGAAVIEKNGWRVWVEHHVTGKRIFEGVREREHQDTDATKST